MRKSSPIQLELLRYSGFLHTPLIGSIAQLRDIELREFPIPENHNIPADAPPIPENLVFGKRMEKYFRYQVEAAGRYIPIAENIQVIVDGVTLGEIDFVLVDSQKKQIVHVELAYKFYLYDPRFSNPDHRWVGPNRKDFLKAKLFKLEYEQFPKFHQAQTKLMLQAFSLPDLPIVQVLNLKAQLYVPFNDKFTLPTNVTIGGIAGFWLRLDEFDEMAEGMMFLPKKKNWGIHPRHWQEWISIEEAREQIEYFHSKRKSPLCWMKTESGSFMRFFVVWWPKEFNERSEKLPELRR